MIRFTVTKRATYTALVATDSQTYRLAPPRPSGAHPALDQLAVQFYEQDDFLREGVPSVTKD